ncbi:MAG: CehA/McbA family metallohydrolase [Longimicrobiales bacterium]
MRAAPSRTRSDRLPLAAVPGSPPKRATRALAAVLTVIVTATALPASAEAQWTNRYPRVQGYGHQVYLEGYELPTLAAGPLDPAPSPVDGTVAVAARGWIWLVEPSTGVARRITQGPHVDSRPAWSPDGRSLAFVRDDGRDLDVVVLDIASGTERVVAGGPVLEMDPAYDAGGTLYWSSGADGTLDIWRMAPGAAAPEPVTSAGGIELRPQPHPDGRRLVYLAKRGGPDRVVVRDLDTGTERVLHDGAILSQLRPALSPDGSRVAFATPAAHGDGWELRVVSVDGGPSVLLAGADGQRLPLAPAWSADGSTIWFAEADRDERMGLWRVSSDGGPSHRVPIASWNWEGATGRLRIHTRSAGSTAPARLHVADADGHPTVADDRQAWFDGQTGTVFFYSSGVVEVEVPAGTATVTAARGLTSAPVTRTADVPAGGVADVSLDLSPVWTPSDDGWMSGDHHFHLNYGGPYRLDPPDAEAYLAGEDLDVATPVLANLHNRFGEQEFWGWSNGGSPPLIRFAQEVRSHFLGHMGLLGTQDLYWPWVWGPGYEVYGHDDRTNAEVTRWARAQGGMSTYVHPVSGPEPFATDGAPRLPVAMVADAVLGDLDALELVCLWSDEAGSADAWYRFLNLGRTVVPTAGTDVMTDFFRTMAVGTTRIYVHTDGRTDFESYLDALRAGRSFVTNGPLLDLRVDDARPGGVVDADGSVRWSLDLHTVVPVDSVQILVNGRVAWAAAASGGAGSTSWSGTLDVPSGGWVAARATGPATTAWPAMDSYAFGHTSPVWIGTVGSVDPAAEQQAARELLDALDGASARLRAGYGTADIPRLERHFAEARAVLERILGG